MVLSTTADRIHHDVSDTTMTILQVQRWVISVLVCAVSIFPVGALIATSVVMGRDGQTGTAAGLCVMAVIIGVLAVVAGRLIHRVNPVSGYSAVGAVPGLVALTWLVAVV